MNFQIHIDNDGIVLAFIVLVLDVFKQYEGGNML